MRDTMAHKRSVDFRHRHIRILGDEDHSLRFSEGVSDAGRFDADVEGEEDDAAAPGAEAAAETDGEDGEGAAEKGVRDFDGGLSGIERGWGGG